MAKKVATTKQISRARSYRYSVSLNQAEREMIDRVAARLDLPVTIWLRCQILPIARKAEAEAAKSE
jgi:hypothetical protein